MKLPLSFFVAGIPKGMPRARATRFGKHARVYNPADADDWKMIVRNEGDRAWKASGDQSPFYGPLKVDLNFYFQRPKNHYRRNGELKLDAPIFHTSKPDRDNLDKAVLDALVNLGLIADDKLVCDGRISKQYSNESVGCWIGCCIKISEA